MSATTFQNEYTVGKGRLFFAQFFSDDNRVPISGLKYFGNTPSFEAERRVTTLDHYDSDAGQKIKDDSIDIQTEFGGKFTVDNITGDNLALLFGGSNTKTIQAAGTSYVTQTTTITPDTYYAVGENANNPPGAVGTSPLTITTGGTLNTAVPSDGSVYNYDPNTGLIYVTPTATPGAIWSISYELAAATTQLVVEQGQSIFGELRFISNNPKGQQWDWIIPYCKISADAAMPLKGDTWMTMPFSWEALQLNQATRRVYIRQRPASLINPNGP